MNWLVCSTIQNGQAESKQCARISERVDTTTRGRAYVVRRLTAEESFEHIPPLADVLIDCVEGGASVSFMLPIARQTALDFWRRAAEGVAAGHRVLLAAFDQHQRLIGTVQLLLGMPENQPHRADVAKMLVHRSARGRGVAQALLEALDIEARRERRTVLVLDTVTGSDAERVYARAGWVRVGEIPRYALMPTGEFCSTTYFYKHLPDPPVAR